MKNIYELNNISRIYGGRKVLDIDEFKIEKGTILGVEGHNGSGKSTLMRILAFLECPDSGEVYFDGIKASCSAELRKRVTLLTQEPYLLKRSVLANVEYGLKIRKVGNCESIVRESLEMVGLNYEEFAKRSWLELSGGECQRVALASRLAINPDVLLLDEPTAALDRESTELIYEAVVKVREEKGTTLVIVSHDQSWLHKVSDKVVKFKKGKLY